MRATPRTSFLYTMIKNRVLLFFSVLGFSMLACNAFTTIALPKPDATIEPTLSLPTKSKAPLNENDVPRVSVQDAKEAFDNHTAVFMDVRSKASYDAEHIPNAFSTPLEKLETNPSDLGLPLDHWIIPYCT